MYVTVNAAALSRLRLRLQLVTGKVQKFVGGLQSTRPFVQRLLPFASIWTTKSYLWSVTALPHLRTDFASDLEGAPQACLPAQSDHLNMADPVVTKKSKKSKKTQAAAEPESAAQQAAQAVPLQPKPVAAISVNTNGGLLSSKKKHKKRKAPEEEQPLPAAKAAEPQAAAETEEQPNKKRKKQKTPAAPEPSSNQDLAKAAAADGASTALTGLLEVQAQLPTADAMPAGTSSTKKKRKKAKTAAAMPSAPSTPAQPDIPASAPEATPGLPEPSLADSPADGKKKKKKRKSSAAEVPSAAAADEPTAVITTTVTSTGPDSAQAVSTSVVVPKSAVKVCPARPELKLVHKQPWHGLEWAHTSSLPLSIHPEIPCCQKLICMGL